MHDAEASRLSYALVSAAEVPNAEPFPVHPPSPLDPLGAGEGGTIPAPAAIANAGEDAPVTPARVVETICGGGPNPPEGP